MCQSIIHILRALEICVVGRLGVVTDKGLNTNVPLKFGSFANVVGFVFIS